ncbi:SphA family protein [Nitrosomonas nitrosa]|uniref:SphA family protein n=1 Tax=Nitrosomonas nitrosa TaxID=52442 RepID=UPI0023F93FAC|nr:transporter [Nitrosomonas nitrosa]MCO6434393.1 transporter [Nitrosomonas nitrosa]
MTIYRHALFLLAIASKTGTALATEGGGSIYPLGAEEYICCALPKPGIYGMLWGRHFNADKIRNNDGKVVSDQSFKVKASAIVPRIVWITPVEIMGASLGFHAIMPIVNLNVKVAPGVSQNKTGIGDMTVGGVLGWRLGDKLHSVAALEFFIPTGDYHKNNIANIGRNHWAVQPVLGVTRIDPIGLNMGIKTMWTYNFRNKDTNYLSGQELIIDYTLGWGVGKGWTLGVGGYAYWQVTNDSQDGKSVPDNKGRAYAIGPSIRYDSGKKWFITGKYQVDTGVRNRADGTTFWLKAVLPF